MRSYTVHNRFEGSTADFVAWIQERGLAGLMELHQSPSREAWVVIAIFGAIEAFLQLCLPGKKVTGPITPKGNIPVYKAS